jgi:hypothetical protein
LRDGTLVVSLVCLEERADRHVLGLGGEVGGEEDAGSADMRVNGENKLQFVERNAFNATAEVERLLKESDIGVRFHCVKKLVDVLEPLKALKVLTEVLARVNIDAANIRLLLAELLICQSKQLIASLGGTPPRGRTNRCFGKSDLNGYRHLEDMELGGSEE